MTCDGAIVELEMRRNMTSERSSQHAFLGISALFCVVSAALTIRWCASMSEMAMPMPGGWTMSMMWMRMPGQTWLVTAASFIGMWLVMMVAMMLPSLVPMLLRYRAAVVGTSEAHLGVLTVIAGLSYFFVWTILGMLVFPLGVGLAAMEMEHAALARAVPLAVGTIVVIAGALQFSRWKTHCLVGCRVVPGDGSALPADSATAWRHGVELGLHCAKCCGNLMAILLVVGVMDIGAMAAVAVATTAERLAPADERAARVLGVVIIAAGLLLIVRATGLA